MNNVAQSLLNLPRTGKRVLVTGGGSGAGADLALGFAHAGAAEHHSRAGDQRAMPPRLRRDERAGDRPLDCRERREQRGGELRAR